MKLPYWEGIRNDTPKWVWRDGFWAGVAVGIAAGVLLTVTIQAWFF